MKISHSTRRSGLTVTELLVSLAVGGFALAAVFSGAISMQRCFVASEDFLNAKREQTRLSDYLALDLRRATHVETGSDGVLLLRVKMPDYYDEAGEPRTPTITRYVHSYGNPAVSRVVEYLERNGIVYRKINDEVPEQIATGIEDFEISIEDEGRSVSTAITFAPKFSRAGMQGDAGARAGTTVYCTTLLRNIRQTLP